ncbi:MAG: MarR family winged helix-turn-helix transcriptional regulator [Rhodomicrobiaceae bacterium]
MEDRVQASLIALRRILHATEQNVRALARTTGLTVSQLIVLEIVAATDRVSPKGIAGRAGIGQATATSLIDKLEARGFVIRTRGKRDRRIVWVSATEAGHEILQSAPNPLQRIFAQQFSRLADWEQAMLVSALERVGDMMNAGEVEPSPMLEVAAIEKA